MEALKDYVVEVSEIYDDLTRLYDNTIALNILNFAVSLRNSDNMKNVGAKINYREEK